MGDIYGGADAEGPDEEKPTWDDDIDITDIVPEAESSKKTKKKKSKKKKGTEADEDGVDLDAMDADVYRDEDDEVWDGTEEMRKRVLDKYMDEISCLEFNDMVCLRIMTVPPLNLTICTGWRSSDSVQVCPGIC
jgi:protein KRI1